MSAEEEQRRDVKLALLAEVIADYEREFGEITAEEMVAVASSTTVRSAVDDVLGFEMELLRPEVRASRERLESLLDDDFVEIGASGRRWTREAIIGDLVAVPKLDDVAVSEEQVRRVSDDVILVSYVTTTGQRRVVRTSWWRRSAGTWKCFFHQGTVDPTGEFHAGRINGSSRS